MMAQEKSLQFLRDLKMADAYKRLFAEAIEGAQLDTEHYPLLSECFKAVLDQAQTVIAGLEEKLDYYNVGYQVDSQGKAPREGTPGAEHIEELLEAAIKNTLTGLQALA